MSAAQNAPATAEPEVTAPPAITAVEIKAFKCPTALAPRNPNPADNYLARMKKIENRVVENNVWVSALMHGSNAEVQELIALSPSKNVNPARVVTAKIHLVL